MRRCNNQNPILNFFLSFLIIKGKYSTVEGAISINTCTGKLSFLAGHFTSVTHDPNIFKTVWLVNILPPQVHHQIPHVLIVELENIQLL